MSKLNSIDKRIKEINIKMLDFNIFYLIKNKDSDDWKSGDAVFIIQFLDKKYLRNS